MIDTIRLIATKEDIAIDNFIKLINIDKFNKIERTNENKEKYISYNIMLMDTIRIFVTKEKITIEYSLAKLINSDNITNILKDYILKNGQTTFQNITKDYIDNCLFDVLRLTRLDFSFNTQKISVGNFNNKILNGRKKVFMVKNKEKFETINMMSNDQKNRLLIYDKIAETKLNIKKLKAKKEHKSELKANILEKKILKIDTITRIEKRNNINKKKILFPEILKIYNVEKMKKELIKELNKLKENKIVSLVELYKAVKNFNNKHDTKNITEVEIFFYQLYKESGLNFQKFYNLNLKNLYDNKDNAYNVTRRLGKIEKKINENKTDNIKLNAVITEIANS